MARRQCHFKDVWLDSEKFPEFHLWLRKVKDKNNEFDNFKALCCLCKTGENEISLGNMGVAALRKHSKTQKHIVSERMFHSNTPLNSMLTAKKNHQPPVDEQVQLDVSSLPSTSVSTSKNPEKSIVTFSKQNLNQNNVNAFATLDNFVTSELVTKAEILYAPAQIVRKGSLRQFELVAELFPIMFPDSQIAKKMSIHKDKLSYVVTHGLGPYLQEELSTYVQKQKYFSISFDESLNKVSQKGQMDLVIRFWRDDKNV